ncbi:MAG: oligoendopeptidase F [Bacilli bacterium]|nr:oligoendopeptidase F [Bacilli bacterium]
MNYDWDLTNIYKTNDDFEKDLKKVDEEIIPEIAKLEGKLNEEANLCKMMELSIELEKTLQPLWMYASCASDLDKRNLENNNKQQRVRILFQKLGSALSFADPEILALGEEKVMKFFEDHKEYQGLDFGYKKLFHNQKYVLPGDKERLLSFFSPLLSGPSSLYSKLSTADRLVSKVTLDNGEEVEVNGSNWTGLIAKSASEAERQRILEALYVNFDTHKNTYAEIYSELMAGELADVKARGHKSILSSHLYHNNIPESVFLNLIEVASTNNEDVKRYEELKRKYLGIEEYHTYDRFLEIARSEKTYTYEEARELFYKSIEWYPEDYQAKAHEATREGYVDVNIKPAKRGGAYSTGGSNVHPYILLNYDSQLNDVFTLAHEAGHSVHTLYSEEAQPLGKQDYTIFVAEIASTFNEHNLLDYLIKSPTLSKNDKIALLQKSIDEILQTFYRQALFAHYEYKVSQMVENDEPIDYKVLSDIMIDLYKQYYGLDITKEKVKPLVWAYIPHLFNSPFYVYQYATSFTASLLIYERIKAGEEGAFDKYLDMLRMGGSAYPLDEVKAAGVNFEDKDTFLACPKRLKVLVDELEELLK